MTIGYMLQGVSTDPNTYQGFYRAKDSATPTEGEQWVASLDGWEKAEAPDNSPAGKKLQLATIFNGLSEVEQLAFAGVATSIGAALDFGNVNLALGLLAQAAQDPQANADTIAEMQAVLEA